MEFNVIERMLLRNLLPQIQGWNYGYLKEARQVVEDLFTPEEEETYEIKLTEDGKSVFWRTLTDDGEEIPQNKDIEISTGLQRKIKSHLDNINNKDQLDWDMLTLCEKFGVE